MNNFNPIQWALRPLKRYADFSGRASRAEFWWFFLFIFIVFIAFWVVWVGALAGLGGSQSQPSAGFVAAFGFAGIFVFLFWLAMLIPTIAVQVRRLHDTNRSGWWLGGFYLLYAVYLAVFIGGLSSMFGAAMSGSTAAPPNPGAMFGGGIAILGLLMFVYMIVLLVFYCTRGTRGANRYGDDPYGPDVEQVFA